jgi:hypothetical protein
VSSALAGLKRLRLRYDGTCVVCGAALAKGSQALYEASTRTVRCIECLVDDAVKLSQAGWGPAAPDQPLDLGIAGASARREHDRRAAKREARVKGQLGERLGSVVVALVPERQSTRAWAKGAQGEEKLAAELAKVPNVVVLHDRRVPRTRGNIDHIVIAPAGIFVVDAKYYQGELRLVNKVLPLPPRMCLYVGGRDCSKLADNMGWQVSAVEELLASVGEKLVVAPALCFLGVQWPLLFRPREFRGVRLESPKSLAKLTNSVQALDAGEIDRLARILANGFPAK